MGRSGNPRAGTAQPRARRPTRRERSSDGRLDPVRWRRPGRGTLLRLAAVAALLVTAAAVSWSRPPKCAAPTDAAAVSPEPSRAAAASRSTVPPAGQPTGLPAGQPTVPPGNVGVPVRLADPTGLAVVHPGNRVDLLRLDDTSSGSTSVAIAALVLDVTGGDDPTTGSLLLALTPTEARQAVTAAGGGFAILIRPG
jgi:hypothetical protein